MNDVLTPDAPVETPVAPEAPADELSDESEE